MTELLHDFANGGQPDSELARQHVWFIKARSDQEKREHIADRKEEATAALGGEVIIASEIQLRRFELKLDEYEAATTAALMQNQKQLDVVTAQIDLMLAQAYVMPDGRRVFKTEDGSQVFDEHGVEVSSEELDFDEISDDAPKWEEFAQALSQENRLGIEREQLISYQNKLDNARDLTDDGEISETELAELEADLDKMMPVAGRSQLPAIENADKAPTVKNDFTTSVAGLEADFQSMDLELSELLPK